MQPNKLRVPSVVHGSGTLLIIYFKNKDMNKTVIKAEVVADSLSPKGDRLTSLKITFPRIILAEINTHRMLSSNTSSSRAIPFKKMVEAVQNDPFIPIAWQKPHKGMQGTEYYDHTLTEEIGGLDYTNLPRRWLRARDIAVSMAKIMADEKMNMPVTKQLANRLLEPFMWTTMLITGSKEGWDNFFNLRCPQYEVPYTWDKVTKVFKSRKDATKYWQNKADIDTSISKPKDRSDLEWLKLNKGQAEIHIMDLAEKIYDAMNESTPKQLKAGDWHIPYYSTMEIPALQDVFANANPSINIEMPIEKYIEQIKIIAVKVSTAMAARVSYTIVGDKKEIDYQKQLELHDRLISQDPPHSSPLEHCARAMTNEEYESFIKGNVDIGFDVPKETQGWCNNIKGFIPYRYMIDNNL